MGMFDSPLSGPALRYREATSADVPAMQRCRASDRQAGAADERMAAYLDGQHHPQQALAARTAFVALDGDDVGAYIAGHATTRHGCSGEVQYLYVAPQHCRAGVASHLLRSMARWFEARGIRRVCVNVDVEGAGAVAFYTAHHAQPLNTYWYIWDDIRIVLGQDSQP